MRAVRCVDQQVVCAEVPEPSGEGVRVTVASAGVCGSDLHMIEMMPIAATLGHEFAGTLDDGRLVAVEPMGACRQCEQCLSGRPYHCRNGLRTFGVDADGGMAERCVVPESSIVLLPAGVAVGSAALVEPLAVAVHAVRLAGDMTGGRVAVIGGGTIGLCVLAALRAQGIADVDVFARHDHQRAAVERLGGAVGERDHSAWNVVFDAAGTEKSLAQAVRMVRPGGRIVLVGVYWTGTVALPAIELCMKEVQLIPSTMYGHDGAVRDFDTAAHVLAANPEIAATLITHRFPLDAVADAFAVAHDRASGAIKVVLEPGAG
ncbi:MAG: Zn-dependent alcohol dehydrogenase [Acidimicrobiales bacterium]|nr:Zn-dependent alcohol dehydrogenase [Acidimicrobiales bacterium]